MEKKTIEQFFDCLHGRARSAAILHRFAWFNRIALFLAFFPTGLIKAFGYPFASPKIGEPLYSFFSTLHSTGPWWRFIGSCQIAAAVLLLVPRCHLLGAILYFPVLINIVFITLSMQFHGTEVITLGMLLANLYLICWDYHLWKGLMPWWTGHAAAAPAEHRAAPLEKLFMGLTAAAGAVALDRLNWFNHWISAGTARTAQSAYAASAVAMLISFLFYGLRKERAAS